MPFIPSNPYKLQSSSTTGSRLLIARWRIVKKRTSDSTCRACRSTLTCVTSWSAASTRSTPKLPVCWRSGEVLRRVGKACRTLAKSYSMNGCVSSGSHICARRGRVLTCVYKDQLVELQEAIGTSLEYFQELEHATRLLNHPGESLVLQTDFLYMVERVDICIEFLKSHVSYDYYFVQSPPYLAPRPAG